MPHSHKAATVYARTLLAVAEAHQQTALIQEEIQAILDLLSRTPGLQRALTMPALSADKKSQLLQPVVDRASEWVRRLLRLLESKRRLPLLLAICSEYLRLEEERRLVKRARVISAVPLSATQLQHLAQGLASGTPGRTYLLHNDVDAGLIAGFRVEEDDRVTDSSLRYQLNALRQKLAA